MTTYGTSPKRVPSPGRKPYRHAGRWILTDTRPAVLAIGRRGCPGNTPRSLDALARRLLVPQIRAAVALQHPTAKTVHHAGEPWTVHVLPIHSPHSRTIIGALACYTPATSPPPPPPKIGVWEAFNTDDPRTPIHVEWSNSLYDRHHLPRPNPRGLAPFWTWLEEYVLPTEQLDTLDRLTTSYQQQKPLITHTANVRSAHGHIDTVQISAITTRNRAGKLVQCGLITTVDADPADHRDATNSVVNAMFTLSDDPMCVIDAHHDHMVLTSVRMRDVGIDLHQTRYLPELCHPDDLTALRRYLQGSRGIPPDPNTALPPATRPVLIRLSSGNSWKPLHISGVPVPSTSAHLLCRARPTENHQP